MKRIFRIGILFLTFYFFLTQCSNFQAYTHVQVTILPPEELYGQLFYDVQSNENIFSDSKSFVDCTPLFEVKTILEKYSKLDSRSDVSISDFINKNFLIPDEGNVYRSDSSPINEHITKLWEILKRPSDLKISGTLIPLPYPYVVPGGRFREMYYWDSYFTMLGLQTDQQVETIQNMIGNFSWLIDTFGFIPNGNRTYYLSRSQPPFYALMISLLAESTGDSIYLKYLKYMEMEYAFWMNGAEKLCDTIPAFRRVVRLPGGEILNRYWDDKNTPRAESYQEDKRTAGAALLNIPGISEKDVHRNIRAAAESGWDFSSRWLSSGTENEFELFTIHTTDIIPVDLNSILYNLEYTLSKTYELKNDRANASRYKLKYENRKKAIIKYCWNLENGFFMDFDFKEFSQTAIFSLAGVFPLFFKIADMDQADSVAKKIKHSFLKAGGVVTSLNNTGQQWDAPNGWAPLQWITIKGLENYGYSILADDISGRWLRLNQTVYNNTLKLLEKYNVEDISLSGGGGEYPNQDGFGWTNGVFQKLSAEKVIQ